MHRKRREQRKNAVSVKHSRMPKGSYEKSCSDCSFDHEKKSSDVPAALESLASTAATTSINVEACPKGSSIGNANGVLACEGSTLSHEEAKKRADSRFRTYSWKSWKE